ncbi:MAG TPA: hypothetical protein VGG74_01450 [Kofleriaceae bacterium]
MSVLLVAFELARPGRNSDAVIARIKEYGHWARVNASTYLVCTDRTSIQVRDWVLQAMTNKDKVYVTVVAHEAAWFGHPDLFSNWVRQHQ